MPVGLETRFKRLLKEIVSVSHGIRHSSLDYANNQNFDVSERLRHQLETIRISADTILQAFAKASLTSYTLDDRIDDWLASKEPHLCLEKLREMNDILRPVDDAEHPFPSLTPAEDKLTAAMSFFDNNKSLFHFLLTPDVWNREKLGYLQSEVSQVEAPPIVSISTGRVTVPLSDVDQATVTDRKKELLRQKLDEISRWITPMEWGRKHKDALRLRQEGTCKWFPNMDVYARWRAPGNHFLWLHGKGGCGKSVLIAFTIEHLRKGLEEGEVVIFFYCDFQDKQSTSSTGLMRSVLSQLLLHICDHGLDPGDFPDEILKQKSNGTLSLDDLGKLCNLVSRAASFFRYEPMIVIDALDECTDIKTLLPALVTLSRGDVRLLVTSRSDETIVDHFAGLQSLSFEDVAKEIAADISLHVRRELDSHNYLRSAVAEMKNEMNTELAEKAEGRFRWVQCQLDTLKRCTTKEELEETLDGLPSELGTSYERILEEIDERKPEGELARRVLAFLMVAMEPLQLTQIIDGLSMNSQERKHDRETQQWLETKLLHSLSSLVSYHEETDVLTLSHYSVKEYLTSRSALPIYQVVFHLAHAEVAQMCMGYISVFLKQEPTYGDLELWHCFPMLSYVLSFGFNHLAYVNPDSPIVLEALQSLGSDVRHHPSHWDRLCELREEILEWPYVLWPSSKHDFVLFTLISYSPPGLLQTFLSSCRPLNPRIRINPLVYAADLRKTEHAIVLLDYGADVNAQGWVVDDSYRASPLEVAIDLGDDVLVGELLRKGCSVTSDVLVTAVCMPWCSTCVLAKLVQTDEFAEWALGVGEEKLYRNVFNSARPSSGDSRKTDEDHLLLARRLHQLSLDLSPASWFGKDLIRRAIHAAHTSTLDYLLSPHQPLPAEFLLTASTGDTSETVPVVRFLLQKGVNVHAISDKSGNTALHLAAMCPWEPRALELTRLLISAGCDPHVLNFEGETSLVVAVRHGHCSVVEFLLSLDLPLPPNVLHAALERCRNRQMVEFLLRSGADVHAVIQPTGNTILHHAIIGPEPDEDRDDNEGDDDERQESECLALVKHLLEAGCDPTLCNCMGETAVEIAMQYDFNSVVQLLLSPNVPLPPNALLTAVRWGLAPGMVEYIIHRGINVHSATSDGDTALHLALSTCRYPEETRYKLVRRLISAGSDPSALNPTGSTALEIAMQRNLASVVELLLPSNAPLPPDVLLTAARQHSTLEMVDFLIQRGADVHSTSPNGDTVLHLALSWNYCEETCCKLVKRFVTAGCDPAARNSSGKTVLEIAMERNFTSVTELLLSLDVPVPPHALLLAVCHGLTLEMIEDLIRRGADVLSTTSDGDTVLHLAFHTNHYSEETCCKLAKRLINAGCDPTALDPTGNTALDIAMQRNFISVVKLLLPSHLPHDILLNAVRQCSTLEVVDYLIQRGADVHSTTPAGDTVLHLTLRWNYDEDTCCKLVKRFITAGCNPIARNSSGKTAVDVAIERNFTLVIDILLSFNVSLPPDALPFAVLQRRSTPDMIEYLIRRGADVLSVTSNGDAALHHALNRDGDEEQCFKLMKILISAGCNTAALDSTGRTAMEIAMQRNFTSVVELLLPSNAPLPPGVLLVAVQQRSPLDMVEYLVQRGANVHSTTSNGDTVLHLALSWNYNEEACCKLVERFISAGCDPVARNSSRKTALEIAIERNFTSVIEVLLSFGAPLPADALLTAARQLSTLEMVDYLIQKGADVHSTTPDGDTVLHLILSWNYDEDTCCKLVKRLTDAGCDPTVFNSIGSTPLGIVIERNALSIVKVLLSGSSVSLPPDVLLIALQREPTLEMVEYLVHRGANVHSTTPGGDTVLHLALAIDRTEEELCKFVECLVNAGCDPSTGNLKDQTVLLAAIKRDYSLVVERLLSFDVSVPPDVLHTALGLHCKPRTIQALVRKHANDHLLQSASGSDWDTLLQLAYTAYSGQYHQQIVDIIEAARKTVRIRPDFEDEAYVPAIKRLRLDEREPGL